MAPRSTAPPTSGSGGSASLRPNEASPSASPRRGLLVRGKHEVDRLKEILLDWLEGYDAILTYQCRDFTDDMKSVTAASGHIELRLQPWQIAQTRRSVQGPRVMRRPR